MTSAITRALFARNKPTRLFSSAPASNKQNFFVYALDKKDEGTPANRYDVRPRHLEKLQPLIDSGTVSKWIMILQVKSTSNGVVCAGLGGMLLSPEAMEIGGCGRKAVGSFLILQARTIEEARKVIESDLYYTSGVVSRSYIMMLLRYISGSPVD